MPTTKTCWIAHVLSLVLAAPCVHGAIITQTMNLTFSSDVQPTQSVSFKEFNPALGTLTSVGLAYNGDYQVDSIDPEAVQLFNTDVTQPTQTASVLSDDLMAFFKDNVNGLAMGATLPTQLKAGPYTVNSRETYPVFASVFTTGTVALNKTITNANDVATFVGNGNFNIYGGITGHEWVTDNNDVIVNAVYDGTITTGTLELIYTYIPVPEPSSAAIFLVVATAILLFRTSRPKSTLRI